jgi:Family of unknown function (DUF6386)
MTAQHFQFATDTATLLVCDPARLKHRLEDGADWWCWPPEEQVSEANEGNAAFFDLGSDGVYQGQILLELPDALGPIVRLACPTGNLFVGAGEEATSDGMEPDGTRGGCFLKVPPGSVAVRVSRGVGNALQVSIVSVPDEARNSFNEPLVLV